MWNLVYGRNPVPLLMGRPFISNSLLRVGSIPALSIFQDHFPVVDTHYDSRARVNDLKTTSFSSSSFLLQVTSAFDQAHQLMCMSNWLADLILRVKNNLIPRGCHEVQLNFQPYVLQNKSTCTRDAATSLDSVRRVLVSTDVPKGGQEWHSIMVRRRKWT